MPFNLKTQVLVVDAPKRGQGAKKLLTLDGRAISWDGEAPTEDEAKTAYFYKNEDIEAFCEEWDLQIVEKFKSELQAMRPVEASAKRGGWCIYFETDEELQALADRLDMVVKQV